MRLVALLTGVLLGLLLLAELAASLTPAGNAAYFIADPDVFLVRKPDLDGYTRSPDGSWIPCRINKDGMRGADLPVPRDPAETRVLCIGDSFTFGGGVRTEEAWPQQLQALLGAPEASGVRVLNGGANGWSTEWQRIFLERRTLDGVRPDVVVLGWNWNDLNATEGSPQQAARLFLGAEGTWLAPFARFEFLRGTHLYRWLISRVAGSGRVPTEQGLARSFATYAATIDAVAIAPERALAEARSRRFGDGPPSLSFWEATDFAGWKSVRANLAAVQALCASRGVGFAVALLPEPTWNGPGTFPGVERMAALLEHLGVPWIDVQPDFLQPREGGGSERRADLWQRYDPVHPTGAGHRIFAERIAALLQARGLLQHKAP